MDYKEKYMKLVEKIEHETEWQKKETEARGTNKGMFGMFAEGALFAYNSIMSMVIELEKK